MTKKTIDAPVSGGDIGARNASLSIMVGGDKEVFDKMKPYFEIMGKNIKLMGKAGAGQHTKMVNQTLIATNMIGVCEGLLYAYQAGLDLHQCIEAIGSGAAGFLFLIFVCVCVCVLSQTKNNKQNLKKGSFSINVLGKRIADGDFEPGFFVEHFIKDMVCH